MNQALNGSLRRRVLLLFVTSITAFVLALLCLCVCSPSAYAYTAGKIVGAYPIDLERYPGAAYGTYNEDGTVTYTPASTGYNYKDINYNYKSLTKLMKLGIHLIIPEDSEFTVNGSLYPSSGTTVEATGATIHFKKNSYAFFTKPTKKIKNVSIIGGTWRSLDSGGRKGSLFQFAFANNILIDGVDVNANYVGHAIEIIACSNVTIQNSTVNAIGSNPKTCKEEQIQIDISTKKTAPKVAAFGAKWAKGQCCKNVTVTNCTVKGARSVGVNWYAGEGGKYKAKAHKNIVITDNTLTSTTSEGLAYFNVAGGEISGNTIKTYATRKQANRSYTIGIHIQIGGKNKAFTKSKLTISDNEIYGNRNGVYFKGCTNSSKTKVICKLGKVTMKSNHIYCKHGKKSAIDQAFVSCAKLSLSSNKLYKW